MKQNDFSRSLTDFLCKHLPGEKGMSYNTIASYKTTFILLLSFLQEQQGIKAQAITFEHLTKARIEGFLHVSS